MNDQVARYDQPRTRDLIAILVLCPALLAGCIIGPFLPYDDRDHVARDTATGAAPLTDTLVRPNGSAFPLTILTYRIEHTVYYQLLGIKQWAPMARVANLLLHVLAGLALWHICRSLRLSRYETIFVTGAFLLHPLACESVCWVSERKNVLAAATGFGAIAALLSLQWRWRCHAAVVLGAMALLSKPSALGLLPVLIALCFKPVVSRLAPDDANGPPPPTKWWAAVLFAAFAPALVILTLNAASGMTVAPPGGSIYTALLTDVEIVRRYLQSTVWPLDLSAFYSVDPILSARDPRFLANAAVILAVIALTVWASRRRTLSFFLWFWFFAALGPVLNIVATSLLMQDRYLYFSLPAWWGIVALAAEGLWSRLPAASAARMLTSPAAGTWTILIIMAALAAWRGHVWDNPYLLFQDAVKKQPRSVLANLCFANTLANLADGLEDKAQTQEARDEGAAHRLRAIQYYQRACDAPDLDRLPALGLLYLNLALVQEKAGQAGQAAATLRAISAGRLRAAMGSEHILTAHQRLAALHLRAHRADDALVEADQALTLDMAAPRSWLLAGQAFEELGRTTEALAAYQNVKEGSPEHIEAEERIKALSRPR